jgi:DNA (cytosine-5)-methyltransferase 1
MENVKLLYVDLFCGAGGTSTGIESARLNGEKCAKVIACVDYDANAIASHAANHPDALHFTEDIRTMELLPLLEHLKKMKAIYPDALVVLWASLECTNFSKAKGGCPRDVESRELAEHLYRYIESINPDYIQIENVEEFIKWSDLDENGKPVNKEKGKKYTYWAERVKEYGYSYEYRILNAADYGAYTSRKRFFGIFAKHGLPIVFPSQTHAKNPLREKELSGVVLERWKPVKDVLDFSDEGESIFTRKKPLSDKTLERIYAGLIKFVAGEKDKAQFLSKYYNGHPESKNISIEEPAHTVTSIDHHALTSARFISSYCGGKENQASSVSSVENSSPAVTVFDQLSLVSPNFIANEYSGGGQHSSIDEVCPAVLTQPKQKVVSCKWMLKYNSTNGKTGKHIPPSVDEPSPVVSVQGRLGITQAYYLMNPQYCSAGGSVENPCFTIIARMDKKPPYLIMTETGEIAIEVYETDSEPMRRIKKFMALYGIIDIKMRMLKILELLQIMGFPADYVLIGNKMEQKKGIGNAVEVTMSRVLCETSAKNLKK